jgi:hypothetical protein
VYDISYSRSVEEIEKIAPKTSIDILDKARKNA